VYQNGQILCCTTDEPFTLYDINDNGFIVGLDPYSGWSYLAQVGGVAPNTYANIHLTFTDPTFDPFYGRFTRVDDQNRILAELGRQEYMLAPIPEPGSIILFVTLLVGCVVAKRAGFLSRPSR